MIMDHRIIEDVPEKLFLGTFILFIDMYDILVFMRFYI